MKQRFGVFKGVITAAMICAVLAGGLPARGQELIPVSNISGGSSVFVFRRAAKAAVRRSSLLRWRARGQRASGRRCSKKSTNSMSSWRSRSSRVRRR